MRTYERRTRVDAPLDRVRAFHEGADGLTALTPSWVGLELDAVTGPDGEPYPSVLEPGSTIEATVRPFDVGPTQSFTSRITDRWATDAEAGFRDRMVEGPAHHWEHTHRFVADGDQTILVDRVAYELTDLPAGGLLDFLGVVGLATFFWYRQRATQRLLGGDEG